MTNISEFYRDYNQDGHWHPYAKKEILRFVPENGSKVLDVGCGAGSKSKYLKKENNHVTGIDISAPQIEHAKTALDDARVHDLSERLPFNSEEFDVVFSSAVLEHLFDYESVLKEMHRVLRIGGRLIVEVPNVSYWPNRFLMLLGRNLIWIGVGKHIRAFNKHHLKKCISSAGFNNIRILGSILPLPKTKLKIHIPFLKRLLPGLCFTIFAVAEK